MKQEALKDLLLRVARIESRLCQLMLHFGITPKGIVDVETRTKDGNDRTPDRNRT